LRLVTFADLPDRCFQPWWAPLTLLQAVFLERLPVGIAPIAIGMFFLGSLQLLFMGIIGEYIGNIHTQVHNRPLVVERND